MLYKSLQTISLQRDFLLDAKQVKFGNDARINIIALCRVTVKLSHTLPYFLSINATVPVTYYTNNITVWLLLCTVTVVYTPIATTQMYAFKYIHV